MYPLHLKLTSGSSLPRQRWAKWGEERMLRMGAGSRELMNENAENAGSTRALKETAGGWEPGAGGWWLGAGGWWLGAGGWELVAGGWWPNWRELLVFRHFKKTSIPQQASLC